MTGRLGNPGTLDRLGSPGTELPLPPRGSDGSVGEVEPVPPVAPEAAAVTPSRRAAMPPVPDSRELGVPAVAGRTLSSALSPGRPRLGIPPAGSGSDASGMSEPRSASVPVRLVTTPVSVGARLPSVSVGSLGSVPTSPSAVVKPPRTQPSPASVVVGVQPIPVPSPDPKPEPSPAPDPLPADVPALERSARVAGSDPVWDVSHCSGAALCVSEPDSDDSAAFVSAAVPLVDPAPSAACSAAAADSSGEVAEASGCAAAGLMVKAPPRPPRKAPTAAQASPPAPTIAALR